MSISTTVPQVDFWNYGLAENSRVFLIGNGASLKNTNLNLLEGLPCMTVNKSIKLEEMYPKFRSTMYVKVDYSAFDKDEWKDEVMPHVIRGEKVLLWDAFHSGASKGDGNYEFIPDGIGDFDNVTYIPRCIHHYLRQGVWHDTCTGLNSILTMAIWAVQLGFQEIVLVGCDGLFTTPDKDHFITDYYKSWDTDYTQRNNINIGMAHGVIFDSCPIPIYDATVNGNLTYYPKVRLEEIT